LEAETLADQAFDCIQKAIVKGDIAMGAKVSEADLGQRFGFGRAPLREALHRLEGRGLIIRKAHAGARVVTLGLESLMELYTIREALEGMAARLAAQNMSSREVDEMKQLLDKHAEAIRQDNGLAYYQDEGDFDFHFRIIAGSKNARLSQMLTGELYHLLRLYRYRLSKAEGRPDRAFHEHQRIVDALADHDGELAELLMRRHIAAARENLKTRLLAGDW
jgi:DNA-binding GntR family transcriptional regulator